MAIVSEGYRYTRYNDGSEELYDRKADPHEWHNIADNPEKKTVLKKHRAQLPEFYHPALEGNYTGHKAFRATEDAR